MKKLLVILSAVVALTAAQGATHVFCGAGDNLWNPAVEPVDSPEAIESMLEWMNKSYGIDRIYWRALKEWSTMRTDGFAPENLECHGWWRLMVDKYDIDRVVVESAHKKGMEAFFYTGIYEHGLPPESWGPYFFEFPIRMQHPEWCEIDRFGERRAPGPISFTYPEARKALIDQYMKTMLDYNYDGINFYTYVENYGIRYEHEFGFEPAVVAMFNEKYPDVDLKKDKLTTEQAEYWYACRGHFTTVFLRELSFELRKNNKKLSIIIDAHEPDYCQPWWGMPIRGTGKIKMDYATCIKEGIVDEIWVQLGELEDQQRTLDMLLNLTAGTQIKLTVRAINPLDSRWNSYRKKGVTPIAVITWAKNGIESYTKKVETASSLDSANWMVKAQACRDIASGKISADSVDVNKVIKLLSDDHLLVRRNACAAMVVFARKDKSLLEYVEKALFDQDSCVRIGAIMALAKVNRLESVKTILKAVENDPNFQFQFNAVTALGNIGAVGEAEMLEALKSESSAVRKTAIHGLYKLVVLKKSTNVDGIFAAILPFAADVNETFEVRIRAIEQLVGMRGLISVENRGNLINLLSNMTEKEENYRLQLKAAHSLRYFTSLFPAAAYRLRARTALKNLFAQYGDASTRPDKAYGWRYVGNALRAFGADGYKVIREFHANKEDKFLAYQAWQVLYQVQDYAPKTKGFSLVDEETAVKNHEYAPEFPGWRAEW